jgi:hypothetical protein
VDRTGASVHDTQVIFFDNLIVSARSVSDDKTLTVEVPFAAVSGPLRVQTTFGTSPFGPIFTPLNPSP